MRGKNKCKILKQIRRKIADENDIPLVTKECTYQGECSGTCPRCEAELRYLEQQLARRLALGKTVTVAALSVGLMAGAVGCSPMPMDVVGEVPMVTEESNEGVPTETPELIGEVEAESSACDTDVIELDGDVAYPVETFSNESGDYLLGYAPFPVDPEATEAESSFPGSESIYDGWSDGNG